MKTSILYMVSFCLFAVFKSYRASKKCDHDKWFAEASRALVYGECALFVGLMALLGAK